MTMTPPCLGDETWAVVADFPNYQVSSLGRAWGPRGLLKIRYDRTGGYGYFRPIHNGTQVTKSLHVLVAAAFLGPRPAHLSDTLHINGDKTNNAVSNLHYGTRSENELDKVAHGTHQNSRKTHCKRNHEYTPENTGRNGNKRFCRACVPITRAARKAKEAT